MTPETYLLTDSIEDIQRAADLLRQGELVAIPTETVYGLAADATNGEAVRKIFTAKGRPQDNPLIVHIADLKDWSGLVREITPLAQKLAEAFWPGPLTLILPKADCIPDEVSAGLTTVAVRMPIHPVARQLIRESGLPLAAPSANLSGSPSPTTAGHVMTDLSGRIAAVVDGGECEVGLESTVVDVSGDVARLLRPGGITPDMIRSVLGTVEVDYAVTHQLEQNAKVSSPGMKYKHYAPKAQIKIVRGNAEDYISLVNRQGVNKQKIVALCFDEDTASLHVPTVSYGSRNDAESQAHRLFDALRQLDEQGAEIVYAACPSEDGMGLAVYNRLLRAAGFEVINCD